MEKKTHIFIAIFYLFSIGAIAQPSWVPNVELNVQNFTNQVPCHGDSGFIHPIVTGGEPPFLFRWYDANGNVLVDTNSNNTNYNLEGAFPDINGGAYSFEILKSGMSWGYMWDAYLYDMEDIVLNLNTTEISGSSYHISIYGGSDGEIVTDVQGGAPPYSYDWSNDSTTSYLQNVTAGTYSLIITDANGCQKSGSSTLTQPPQPLTIDTIISPKYGGYNVSEYGGKNGKINASISGGAPPYKIRWSNGNPWKDIDTLEARKYQLDVTDANGAVVSKSITLTEPPRLTMTLTPVDLTCFGCSNGSITATISGGVPPYNYYTSTGVTISNTTQTTQTFSNLSSGYYSIKVTDANQGGLKQETFLKEPARDDWGMTGNSNINSSSNFLGTLNNADLVFKTNNTERLRLSGNGAINFPGMTGTGPRILSVDANGYMTSGGVIDIDGVVSNCINSIRVIPWFKVNNIGPYGGYDLLNCYNRFGFGMLAPLERIHINGFSRFSPDNTSSAYLNIGHDGNSKINSYGIGELLINNDSPQNVKVNTGSTRGSFTTGGNTYLASLEGRVGIGTLTPNDNLEIGNYFTLHNDVNNSWIGRNYIYEPITIGSSLYVDKKIIDGASSRIVFEESGSINLQTRPFGLATLPIIWQPGLKINEYGQVLIGNCTPTFGEYLLYVRTGIRTEKIRVDIASANQWSDCVFEKNYNLLSLEEVENYIKQKKHLPNVPSADEVVKTGIDLAEMDAILLTKIEELTLHIIELKKEINKYKNEKK